MLESWPYRTIDVSASLIPGNILGSFQQNPECTSLSSVCLCSSFFLFFGELCKPLNYVGCDADCNVIIRHVNFGTLTCWKNRNLGVLLPLLSCYI